MSGYYDFGINEPIEKKYSDPTELCLANNFFYLKDNPLVQGDATLCNDFMVQRCAKNWDDKCKLFFDQKIDPTFMLEVAKSKYCTLDPNSNCWQVCKAMNPLAQYSPNVCKVYGNQFYKKGSELYDLAGNFSLTSKLRSTSPLTFTKCPVLCQGVEKIEEKDPVMDMCLSTGQCQEVLQNLAIYASEKNLPVNHAAFRDFMNNYIMNKAPIAPKSGLPSKMGNESGYKNFVDIMNQPSITTNAIPSTGSLPSRFADPTASPSSDSENIVQITNCGDVSKTHFAILFGILLICALILFHLYSNSK